MSPFVESSSASGNADANPGIALYGLIGLQNGSEISQTVAFISHSHGPIATSYNSSEYPYGLMPPWMSFKFPTMGRLCFSISHCLHSERLNIMVMVPHGARQHVLKPGSDPKVVSMPPDWCDSELMKSLGTEDRAHDHQMPVFTSDANSFLTAHNDRHLWEVLTAQSKPSIR
ncbi:hypothetical protein F5883DRAFT_590922 [Diaporthe sp. PMI_573]|nr:hypothetical protein F5883DRAFT_590922 [Diaporthaceae sp. PMI_573]